MHKTQNKISDSIGSSHIWRIYLRVKVISMCVSEWQHEVRSIGCISIDYAQVRAYKSSPSTVNVLKAVPEIVTRPYTRLSQLRAVGQGQ